MPRASLSSDKFPWLRLAALVAAVSSVSSIWLKPVEALVFNAVEANCYSSLGDWQSYGSVANQTPGVCGGTCQDAGYTLFAVSGTQCYCGNAMPNPEYISSADTCNTACPYYTSQKCGGPGAFVVYSAGGEIPASTEPASSSSTDAPSSSGSTSSASSDVSTTSAAASTTSDSLSDSTTSPASSTTAASPTTSTTAQGTTTGATTAGGTTSQSILTTGSQTAAATTTGGSTDLGSTTTRHGGKTSSSASTGTGTGTSASSRASNSASPTGGLGNANKTKKGGSGISGGAIAGIVVGVVGGLAVLAALVFLFFLRSRRRNREDDEYYSPHSTPDNFKGGEGPNKSGFTGPYPDYTGQKYPPPPPLGSGGVSSTQSHEWGSLANPVLDQRLNPELLGDPRISIASLADARDYSRQILKVANPDDKP